MELVLAKEGGEKVPELFFQLVRGSLEDFLRPGETKDGGLSDVLYLPLSFFFASPPFFLIGDVNCVNEAFPSIVSISFFRNKAAAPENWLSLLGFCDDIFGYYCAYNSVLIVCSLSCFGASPIVIIDTVL